MGLTFDAGYIIAKQKLENIYFITIENINLFDYIY